MFSPAALAGFSFAAERADAGIRDVISIRAINDGLGGSGTDVWGFEIAFNIVSATANPSAKAYFAVKDTNGNSVADTVDLANTADLPGVGFFRIGTAANTIFVESSAQPTLTFTEPNPWLGGVSSYKVGAARATITAPATGSGALIAQLYVDDGAGINAIATIGGEVGPAFRNIPIVVAPVPEPTTLLAGAATGILLGRRRR